MLIILDFEELSAVMQPRYYDPGIHDLVDVGQ